ncbi:MAG: hypothetical protein FWF87_04850 [Synergistaceae bacterium]|nr:hypothetical protein [Synergistaceae bacterium]
MTYKFKNEFASVILAMADLIFAHGSAAAYTPGFIRAADVIPDAVLDIRYAGEDNFVGSKIDGYEPPRRSCQWRQQSL